MNSEEFIRKIFEIAFGEGAVPEEFALKESNPDYRGIVERLKCHIQYSTLTFEEQTLLESILEGKK